jgi:hypothetical protein
MHINDSTVVAELEALYPPRKPHWLETTWTR